MAFVYEFFEMVMDVYRMNYVYIYFVVFVRSSSFLWSFFVASRVSIAIIVVIVVDIVFVGIVCVAVV